MSCTSSVAWIVIVRAPSCCGAAAEIAQALFVTRKTVETHLSHCYQKLDLHSRAELAGAL